MLRAEGKGVREIARCLDRSPSTISRELRRNAATRAGRLDYRASVAQWHAEQRAKRPKTAKMVANERLREYVQERLAGQVQRPDGTRLSGPQVAWKGRRHGRRKDRRWSRAWSPEQISGRLALDFPDDPGMRISHEAIYQSLYAQLADLLTLSCRGQIRTQPFISLDLTHVPAQRLGRDPQITSDLSNRTAALDHHTRAAIKQLLRVLPRTGHKDLSIPFPQDDALRSEPPSNPAWLTGGGIRRAASFAQRAASRVPAPG